MSKWLHWPENDYLFAKGSQRISEGLGRRDICYFNLNEQTFHKFMMTLPVSGKDNCVIICAPRLCSLSLFLLSEFASVHAIFTSDCKPDCITKGLRRMPPGGKIAFARPGTPSLTLSEFRILHLLIQGVSMKDIADILSLSLSATYLYRKKLSEKMQFSHRAIPVYAAPVVTQI